MANEEIRIVYPAIGGAFGGRESLTRDAWIRGDVGDDQRAEKPERGLRARGRIPRRPGTPAR